MYRKTYIEIHTSHLKHNVATLVHAYPDYAYYIGVVKGNAYGHGYGIAKHLIEAGINYLAVSSLEEAIAVRDEGVTVPILCLEPIHMEDIADAAAYNVTLTLSSYEYFKKLMALEIEGSLKVHLKINSGLNRLGVSDKEEVREIVTALRDGKKIRLEGIYSHFATTGIHDKHWDDQLASFKEVTALVDLSKIPIVHLGRSLTLLNHAKIPFCNAIRVGVAMYGYNLTPKPQAGLKGMLKDIKKKYDVRKLEISETMTEVPYTLKPAFAFYSEIIEIRRVKKGDFVGYGAAFQAMTDCRVGIVAAGYADGFSKNNKHGHVVINGARYKLIGGIDMCMLMVLIDEKVQLCDKVELIGEHVSAISVAQRCGTSMYETLCALKDTLPRLLLK